MKTTLELPNDLVSEAQLAASSCGMSLEQLVSAALRREIESRTGNTTHGNRVEFPILRNGKPGSLQISEDTVRESELEDAVNRSGLQV